MAAMFFSVNPAYGVLPYPIICKDDMGENGHPYSRIKHISNKTSLLVHFGAPILLGLYHIRCAQHLWLYISTFQQGGACWIAMPQDLLLVYSSLCVCVVPFSLQLSTLALHRQGFRRFSQWQQAWSAMLLFPAWTLFSYPRHPHRRCIILDIHRWQDPLSCPIQLTSHLLFNQTSLQWTQLPPNRPQSYCHRPCLCPHHHPYNHPIRSIPLRALQDRPPPSRLKNPSILLQRVVLPLQATPV